ncbi:MAG: metallophosphoesterase [Chthoniobacteraceae bacterium]|nr:metallophosphoesterase [Chthoniobacteraceae bacterium]
MQTFPKKLTRRNFLTFSALGSLSYMRFWEPHWLHVRRQEIVTGKAASNAPLKLLQISDLHASDVVSLAYIESAIALGLAEKPDLICLTGDFITSVYDQFDGYSGILAQLARHAPTFATLGNHDGGLWAGRTYGYPDSQSVRGMLATAGIDLLHNTHRDLVIGGRKLRVVGLGDKWSAELFPLLAFPADFPVADDVFTIALSHNPDTKDDLAGFPWDLMLSGHTHGGQLLVPLVGAPFAPVRDRRFIEGLHRWNDRWLHISKGVGNLHGMRFNCRPEVNLITLA